MRLFSYWFMVVFISMPVVWAGLYVEDGKVMFQVQTYQRGAEKIVLIDMAHVAPKKFFKNVRQTLLDHHAEDTLILEEGVKHCEKEGDTYYVPGPNADFDALGKLYLMRDEIDPNLAEDELSLAGFWKMKCLAGDSLERPNAFQRFKTRFTLYGLIAAAGFLRNQTSLRLYPRQMSISSGDAYSGSFDNPIDKALSGSVIECAIKVAPRHGCRLYKQWMKTTAGQTLTDDYLLNRRNEVVVLKSLKALDSGKYKTILLPWGLAHMETGIIQSLESAGFTKSSVVGMKYTDCRRIERNLVLGTLLGEDPTIQKGCDLSPIDQ